jgi:ABC-type Fe3+ transport system substrate-binding protein
MLGLFSGFIFFIIGINSSIGSQSYQNKISHVPEKIIVGAVINDQPYFDWLKVNFENAFKDSLGQKKYEIEYIGNDILSGTSEEKFYNLITTYSENEIDLFLGGNIGIVNKYQSQLFNCKKIIEEIKDSIECYDYDEYRYIGFYQKRLGLIWNTNQLSYTLSSFMDLKEIKNCPTILPKRDSSASYDLLIALSNLTQEFDYNNGLNKYIELLKHCSINSSGISHSPKLVAQFSPCVQVAWIHDALSYLDEYPELKRCTMLSIPNETVATYSTISLRNKSTVKEGTIALVKYLISYPAQKALYDISYRLPCNKNAFQDYNYNFISGVAQNKDLEHYRHKSFNYAIIGENLTSLSHHYDSAKVFSITNEEKVESYSQNHCK